MFSSASTIRTRRAVLLAFAVVLACVASMVLPAGGWAAANDKIHPSLRQLAKDNPRAQVRVIIRGAGASSAQLTGKVEAKHGQKDKDLPVVGGLSAQLAVQDVLSLADSPDVLYVTPDAPMVPTNAWDSLPGISPDFLGTLYPSIVRAPQLWSQSLTGAGVTVAVIDSGIRENLADFRQPSDKWKKLDAVLYPDKRILKSVVFSTHTHTGNDKYGHGTHVAGILAGGGRRSAGKYIGIAPQANLIDLKVADDEGVAYVSDVIEALQWAIANRTTYNIRVVNLSLESHVPEPYTVSPLDAACEVAWLSGITVVVSQGNSGPESALFPPANDPLVISVGAVDTNGTVDVADDTVPPWSGSGITPEGFAKPELVAPGRRIVSDLSEAGSNLGKLYRDRIVDKNYLSLSGTSMAAPVVSGAAALILQAHPQWTPDQVKGALTATARPLDVAGSGAGEIDVLAAASLSVAPFANRGVSLVPSVAALAGMADFDAATWNAATWNARHWNAATWNAATWNAATWNAATWNAVMWNSVNFWGNFPD